MSTTRVLMEKLPFYLIIYSTTSGLVFLFCSPIRFLLPSWVVNPFSVTQPTDALASFVSIILLSFCIGVPIFFLSSFITGDSGLNHKFMNWRKWSFYISKEEECVNEKFRKINPMKFGKWLRDSGFSYTLDILENERSIIISLMVGSELSLILLPFVDWWLLPVLSLFQSILLLDVLTWLVILPTLLFILSWVSDRFIFRKSYKRVWLNVKNDYIKYLKEEELKLPPKQQ